MDGAAQLKKFGLSCCDITQEQRTQLIHVFGSSVVKKHYSSKFSINAIHKFRLNVNMLPPNEVQLVLSVPSFEIISIK